MELKLQVKKETFTDKNGLERPYASFSFNLGGETFSLVLRNSEDKRLVKHLLKSEGFFDETV